MNILDHEDSEETAQLADAIAKEIARCKEEDKEGDWFINENAFSINAQYEDGEFYVQCSFSEDNSMTIMYGDDSDNETVESLFNLKNPKELRRIASLMLREGWVLGFNG